RRDPGEFFVEPVVVGAARGDGPVFGDDAPDREAGGRIDRGPGDFRLIEKIEPLFGADGAGARALFAAFEKMKMNVIEGGKDLGAIARRHESGNLVHAGPVVDVTVGVDDSHALSSFRAIPSRL